MKITLFSFIAAVIVFITKQIAAGADKEGNIFIPTPKQVYDKGICYFKRLEGYIKKYVIKKNVP